MAQIIKTNTGYMVRVTWRDENGKQHKKSKAGFKTKSAARQAGIEMEQQKYDGKLIPKSKIPTLLECFKNYVDVYKRPTVSKSTNEKYDHTISVLEKTIGGMKINKVTREQYQRFINDYGATHSKETVKKVNSNIRMAVRNAVYDGIINRDFTQNINLVFDESKSMKVDYLNIDELIKVANYVETKIDENHVSYGMIYTAIFTGARLSEIAGLTWNDVDVEHKTISINKTYDYRTKSTKKTKTASSNRTIRINDELVEMLTKLNRPDIEFIFTNQETRTVPTSNAANKTLKHIFSELEIDRPQFHFHSLRHTHVAYLISKGVPIYAISKRLGHSNISTTTDKYAYLIEEYKAKSDDLIEHSLTDLVSRKVSQQ